MTAKLKKKKVIPADWESELVNTDVLVYFTMNEEGVPVVMDLVIPKEQLYEELLDVITDPNDNSDCSEFEMDPVHEEWLKKTHPDWKSYVDPDFYCWCCKKVKECHPEWLEAGENVEEKIKTEYPQVTDEGVDEQETGEETGTKEEAEDEGPFRIFLE